MPPPKKKAKTKNTTATKRKKNPLWLFSDARQRIMQDMIDGKVPIDEEILDPERLFNEFYANLPDFKDFPFNKARYKERIKSLQDIVKRHRAAAKRDAEAFAHDRALNKQQTHNSKGEPLWRDHEADKWLKVDMSYGKHLQMKPAVLRETRPCYKLFSKRRFSKRIDYYKEKAKPYGCTPGQNKSRKKKHKHNGKVKIVPELRRPLDSYCNEE